MTTPKKRTPAVDKPAKMYAHKPPKAYEPDPAPEPDPEPFAPEPDAMAPTGVVLQVGPYLFEVHEGGLRPCDAQTDVSSLARLQVKAYQR